MLKASEDFISLNILILTFCYINLKKLYFTTDILLFCLPYQKSLKVETTCVTCYPVQWYLRALKIEYSQMFKWVNELIIILFTMSFYSNKMSALFLEGIGLNLFKNLLDCAMENTYINRNFSRSQLLSIATNTCTSFCYSGCHPNPEHTESRT